MIKIKPAANAPEPVTPLTPVATQKPQGTRVGAAVFLISPTGQFLMKHRTQEHGNDTWGLVGGHVEMGEDPMIAVTRETREEVDVRLYAPALVGYTSDIYPNGQHYVTFFFGERVADIHAVKNMEPDKCDELKWVYADELPDNMMLSLQNFVDKIGQKGLSHMLATFPR